MRQYIGAVITVRKIFTPLCLFLQTSPNNLAVASGNKNRFFTQKLQINFDRHNAGLTFNYCLRFDPPNYSFPSTFKTVFRSDLGLSGYLIASEEGYFIDLYNP
jgi:hypothetical protein